MWYQLSTGHSLWSLTRFCTANKRSQLWIRLLLLKGVAYTLFRKIGCKEETMTTQSCFNGQSMLFQFWLGLLSSIKYIPFQQIKGSNDFKTQTVGRANQWQREVTWLTYHKRWALSKKLFSSFFLPVCADCRWDVIVLPACLGLQHPLKSWWFDLWVVGSSFTNWSHLQMPRTWKATDCSGGGEAKVRLCLWFRGRIRVFLDSLTETSLCPTYNVFHTAISWQLITCLQHNRGNLTFIRLYHMRR